MGSWLANNIRLCDGLTTMMSYWTFSDVFEEQGVVKKPFYGGYGLIAAGGIPKAGFNAFAMLHRLGDQRLSPELKDALVTKRADGTLVIAVWNYADPGVGGAPANSRSGRTADALRMSRSSTTSTARPSPNGGASASPPAPVASSKRRSARRRACRRRSELRSRTARSA